MSSNREKEDLRDKGVGFMVTKTAAYIKFAAINALKELHLDSLTLDQYEILYVLTYNDGVYQRQLGKIVLKDRPNITRLINILLDKGMIERRQDEENKRLLRIYITDEGRKSINKLAPLKQKIADKLLRNISGEEINSLLNVLEKMRNNLSDYFTMQT